MAATNLPKKQVRFRFEPSDPEVRYSIIVYIYILMTKYRPATTKTGPNGARRWALVELLFFLCHILYVF